METLIKITELIGAAVGGGWLVHILSIRAKVRTEKAGATKAEAEAGKQIIENKSDEIENIRKTMDAVYKPIIDDLSRQVAELRDEVREVRDENSRLKDENADLRRALREIRPDIVPSVKSTQAQNQARGKNGRFVKKDQQ